jgi:hypothetical protein
VMVGGGGGDEDDDLLQGQKRTALFWAITQRVVVLGNSLPTFRDNLSGTIFNSQESKQVDCNSASHSN